MSEWKRNEGEPMKEIEAAFQSDVELRGTLALPERNISEKHPAVLLLHGSGPLDRNENAKFAKMNIFKLLSDSLCENGFAVLRYDISPECSHRPKYLGGSIYKPDPRPRSQRRYSEG